MSNKWCLVAAALVLPVVAAVSGAPAGLPAAVAAGSNAAGHDYATDVFADPWDYSNVDDLLLDAGPTLKASSARLEPGRITTHFTGNGYISPSGGSSGGKLFLGRAAGKAGNALS